MVFDWEEYLILAEELIDQHKRPACVEAKVRCSLSRAYYAAYSEAFGYLVKKGSLRPTPGRAYHTDVIKIFGNKEAKREAEHSAQRSQMCRDISSYLGDMFENRIAADYHNPLRISNLTETTTLQLLNADEVITLVRKL